MSDFATAVANANPELVREAVERLERAAFPLSAAIKQISEERCLAASVTEARDLLKAATWIATAAIKSLIKNLCDDDPASMLGETLQRRLGSINRDVSAFLCWAQLPTEKDLDRANRELNDDAEERRLAEQGGGE